MSRTASNVDVGHDENDYKKCLDVGDHVSDVFEEHSGVDKDE